jgi:hypothetical protein
MRNVLDANREVSENALQLVGIWPCAEDTVLRTPKLRSGNRLHCFGELLCIFDGTDAPPNVQQIWHT